jgi:hypothetical protein
MDRIRRLTDELSLIQQPMSDREILGCVLDGLDLDYYLLIRFTPCPPHPLFYKSKVCFSIVKND